MRGVICGLVPLPLLEATSRAIGMKVCTRRDFIQNVLKSQLAFPLAFTGSCSFFQQREEELVHVNPLVNFKIVSETGSTMSDGNEVPACPDGMMCTWSREGDYLLIRNHELEASNETPAAIPARAYDPDAPGGVTTLILDKNLNRKNEYYSVTGTSRNCLGGRTPWNTWLTCEETFQTPEDHSFVSKRHGYVFEVDPYRSLEVNAVPIKAMGRFVHEACGFHEKSGVIYMTEDKTDGCFYRFIPHVKDKLHQGGRLEALKVHGDEIKEGKKYQCSWIPLKNPDPDENNLRITAFEAGATGFVRGEGIAVNGNEICFSCTTGGEAGFGQIFVYDHGAETLELLYESRDENFLKKPDNLTFNHYGDLIICEDRSGPCRLLGLTPEKKFYEIASNNAGEWAGVCFSPDNKYLFANILQLGQTFAFEVPWEKLRNV